MLETAIAGGGGLLNTLKHSYSTNDLHRASSYDQHLSEDDADGGASNARLLSSSLHTAAAHDHFHSDDDDTVQTTVTDRNRKVKVNTRSVLALGNETTTSDHADNIRRSGGSVRQTSLTASSSQVRAGSVYATLARKSRKQKQPLSDFQPNKTRSTLSKESVLPRREQHGKVQKVQKSV